MFQSKTADVFKIKVIGIVYEIDMTDLGSFFDLWI